MLTQPKMETTSRREATTLPAMWEPFGIMNRIRENMDKMFEDLFRGYPMQVEALAPTEWMPAVNLHQVGDNLVVECALPGVKKNEIEIQAVPDFLHIKGEYKRTEEVKTEGRYRTEICQGRFFRKLPLPLEIKPDHVKAVLENGILKVTMPLAHPAQVKGTPVKID